MINLVTPDQFIVGLTSYRQIYRAIIEHRFKNIVFCYYEPSTIKPPRSLMRLINQLISPIRKVSIIALSSLEDKQKIDAQTDLIISYGSSKLHSILKPMINSNCALYCIEQLPTRISSYDAIGINNNVVPNLIFNECSPKREFNMYDIIYFMADIGLALQSCLNCQEDNNFIFDCAISGMIHFLTTYQQLQTNINNKTKKQLYITLAHADILMKNAYNTILVNYHNKDFNNVHHWLVYYCHHALSIAKELFGAKRRILIQTLNEYKIDKQQIISSLTEINAELEKNEKYKELLVEVNKEAQ